jgi:hypothetical protein
MPTIFSHAIAAAAIGTVTVAGPSRARLWALGALCAVVPDLDVIHYPSAYPTSKCWATAASRTRSSSPRSSRA